MRWLNRLRLRLRSLFRRHAAEGELDDEIRFHLDRSVELFLARGLPLDAARRLAVLEIGGVEQVREECREARGWNLPNEIWRDVAYGSRMLRKSPGVAVAAILTLALGIGANVSMLGVVDALLFRTPAHVLAPSRLIEVGLTPKEEPNTPPFLDFTQYERLAQNSRLLDLAAEGPLLNASLGRGIGSRQIQAEYVSYTYFHVLGARMALGRAFDASEDRPSGSVPVVVLSYDLWQGAFGGDAGIVGRTVLIDGRACAVVGVAPKGFTGTGFLSVGAWLPIESFRGFVPGSSQPPLSQLLFAAIGRLRNGITAAQASAGAAALLPAGSFPANLMIRTQPLFAGRWSRLSPDGRLSLWIAGVALIVLLIACVNVSGLLLARMEQRQHEMAVRQQLGATRQRILRQVLIEGLLVGAAGGAAALFVALLVQPLVRSFLLPAGFYEGSFLNGRLLVMTAVLAALAGCASGFVPAWRASSPHLADALKSGERGHTRGESGVRWALVVAQLALTLLLAVGAGLFIRSLRKAVSADNLGFDPSHLLQATVALSGGEFSPAGLAAAYERMRDRAKHVPGVTQVALSNMLTLFFVTSFAVASDAGQVQQWSAVPRAVTSNYFLAMGIPILRGRPLLPSDTEGSAPIVVVNQSLARELWPGRNPIGQCLRTSAKTACARVVGLVPDTWPAYSINGSPQRLGGEFYVPLSQAARQGASSPTPDGLLIRTRLKPAAVAGNLFAALESISPGGRYVSVQPYSEILDPETRSWRLGATMFSLFAGLALALAAVGIYGVLAFLVRQRTAEIGVRMAFGATPRDILGMVIGEGMKLAALGTAIGAVAALALTRLMKSLLYGVSATDPWSFTLAALVLALVAFAACSLAAWRAMRLDPSIALRHE